MTLKEKYWLIVLGLMIAAISYLHYNTPTTKMHFHLVYMQLYFVPILLAAFTFGIKGGLITAITVSAIYFPHIMLHWGGLKGDNLIRFMQIILFNVIGYITGSKSQGERQEKEKYNLAAEDLKKALSFQKKQSAKISEMEDHLRSSDRLAIVGELTASLAHEVRNPLASIRGAVEIIRDAVPEEVRKLEFFDILLEDTDRLNRVVETYLSLSYEKKTIVEVFDIVESLEDIFIMTKIQARKKGLYMSREAGISSRMIRSDKDGLWQILINVILNSIQSVPTGGKIHLAINDEPIDNRDGAEGKSVLHITVSDDGPGIPESIRDRIFKPFFTTRENGTGLGLAIVSRIAERNNWEIDLQSSPESGTVFSLDMPSEIQQGSPEGDHENIIN